MNSRIPAQSATPSEKSVTTIAALLTPKEAARLLKVSLSWLAKARMRGDGPPYIKLGRSIRYTEAGLLQWMKSCQRFTITSQYFASSSIRRAKRPVFSQAINVEPEPPKRSTTMSPA